MPTAWKILKGLSGPISREVERFVVVMSGLLGLTGLVLTTYFLSNWEKSGWNGPWAFALWIFCLVFNIFLAPVTNKKSNYLRFEYFRVAVNLVAVVALFYLTGGAAHNFWYFAAMCGFGSSVVLVLYTGKGFLAGWIFLFVYLTLYIVDVRTIDAGSLQKTLPIALMLGLFGVLGNGVFRLMRLQNEELIAEKTKVKLAELEKSTAEQANLEKNRFLANMNHEIRTPLTAIMGFIDLLKLEGKNSHGIVEYVSIVDRNARHLKNLVDDFLDLSKIDAGELTIEKIKFNLINEIEGICNQFRESAVGKGLVFSLEYATAMPEVVHSDPGRIRQILLNILGNAQKFTDIGKIILRVGFIPDQNPVSGQIEFIVTDTGCGISQDNHSRLFKPFSQADITTSRKYGGTGLGLVLSRKIANALGGDVELQQSVEGAGSTFRVTIGSGELSDIKFINPAVPRSPDNPEEPMAGRRSLTGLNVLVVEDNLDTRTLVKRVLTTAGAAVKVASNGLEGVTAASACSFDVILMDLKMPEMDGYQATARIRASGYTKPIVALTADATNAEKSKALNSGLNDFRTKPISSDQLIELVDSYRN